MAAGGMYDLVGGGFHRYSVDEQWLVPHFEKMLYDNALLVPAYLHAWVVTGEERYRKVAESTRRVHAARARAARGGIRLGAGRGHRRRRGADASRWTPEELEGVSRRDLLQPFEHGRFVVRGELTEEERRQLFDAREQRPKPARDDKAIASWNGLALAALAEAGRRLDRAGLHRGGARGSRGSSSARSRTEGGRPPHLPRRPGQGHGLPGGLRGRCERPVELHVATGEPRWLHETRRLALLAVELFADEERGGFFLTPVDAEQLVARKKELDDHPTPSGNSMMAYVLLRLARIYGDDESSGAPSASSG